MAIERVIELVSLATTTTRARLLSDQPLYRQVVAIAVVVLLFAGRCCCYEYSTVFYLYQKRFSEGSSWCLLCQLGTDVSNRHVFTNLVARINWIRFTFSLSIYLSLLDRTLELGSRNCSLNDVRESSLSNLSIMALILRSYDLNLIASPLQYLLKVVIAILIGVSMRSMGEA